MRRIATAIVLATSVTLAAQQRAPEIESITARDMKADLTFLASDSMAGRLTDTPQNALAAEWIASRFERMGLKAIGDNGTYYQGFRLATATLGEGNRLNGAPIPERGPNENVRLSDWYPARFSPRGTARGPLVFAGFGITSRERNHDDYAGDVKGKIVLVLDHEPGERDENSPFDGVVTAQAADQLQKALAAQAKGAAGILFVSDVHNHPAPAGVPPPAGMSVSSVWPERPPRIPRYMLGSWVEQVKIPAAHVLPTLAAKWLAALEPARTLEELGRASEIAGGLKPVPIPGVEIELTTSVNRTFIDDRNVVAMIEGADTSLKEEVVIVCAHYDHDGTNGTSVLNGADDDGSGTIGVIEIAEAYALAAANGIRPKRSVLFAAWNSEERGLFGAWAYTQSPIVPLAKTVAVLNMDMIGRNEEVPESGGGRFRGLDVQTAESNNNAVNIIGTTRSASLKRAVEEANAGIGLTLRLRYDNNISQLMRRSDHWPFLNNGVPAVWVHTGLHPDYHTANDDADRINYPKMEKIGRMVHQASWDLANTAARPTLDRRTNGAQEVTKEAVPGVRNFARLGTTVACAGATPAEALPEIKKMGFVSVINLRLTTESGAEVEKEEAMAKELGLRYFHVPFAGKPDPKAAEQFLAAITSPGAEPAFIHCAGGNRAATMWLIKRLVVDGWEEDRAVKEAVGLGQTSENLRKWALEYARGRKRGQ